MQHSPREDLSPYFQTLDDLARPFDWKSFFGNDHPIEIDVGSGRGLFLIRTGLENPDTNYTGIEIDYREGRRAARRAAKREMPNVRVWGGDVHVAFNDLIPPKSVSAVHVYFPDPWWKRRHRRRRVFTDVFVDEIDRVIKPGGLVHSWSDVEEYFEIIQGLMDHDPRFETLPLPPEKSPEHDLDYQTSFDRKKRKLGMPIWRGMWRRKPND